MSHEKRIAVVKEWKTRRGKNEYLRHLAGKPISRPAAVLAKCAECMAGYADGANDCRMPACPLYAFMPYREAKAPRPERKPQSEAQIAARKANAARMHEKRQKGTA